MEDIIQQISMLHHLYLSCLTGMIICFVISAILFHKLQMKDVTAFFVRQKLGRKTGKIMIWMFCGWITLACEIPGKAAQDTKAADMTESESPENTVPVLEMFMIQSGSDLPEDALIIGEGNLCYAKNLKELEDVRIQAVIYDDAETFDPGKVLLEYCVEGLQQWTVLNAEQQEWIRNEQGSFETVYLFDGEAGKENVYSFRISYVDIEGNELILGENVPAEGAQGCFTLAQKIVLDKVSPKFQAIYTSETGEELKTNEAGNGLEPYYNAAKEVHLRLQVTETNLDNENTAVKVSVLDRNNCVRENVEETELYSKTWAELAETVITDEDVQTLPMKMVSDGHYVIEIKVIDKAGNEAVHQRTFALDHNAPEISSIVCTLENGDLISRLIHQLTFGYFAKEKTLVHIKACDLVSGVAKISYTYEDVETKDLVTEIVEVQESESDKNMAEYTVELPFSFKGTLKAYGIDQLENTAKVSDGIGVIAESKEKHEESSGLSVSIKTAASKTKYYYSGDVEVSFAVCDTYSGVNSVSYLAGEGLAETVTYENETEPVTSMILRNYRILASENQKNEIALGLQFTDNAGYTSIVPEDSLQKIHIDTVKPKIRVEYDNNDVKNEKYYREMRTATVYVTERNFDPEDVHFELSGPEPVIGGWIHMAGAGCRGNHEASHTGHTDECVWKCSVEFQKDGEYRFGFHCIDLAGNEGRYERTDEFVIDQTIPAIQITYDNQNARNEIYYNAPRTAVVTIEERNFAPSEVAIALYAKNNGTEIQIPAVTAWVSTGDVHRATIQYDYDGMFNFDIACEDLAGNESADYPGDEFVIDLTIPEITIDEVMNRSANNGTVSPMITILDTNYEGRHTNIQIEGWYRGSLEVPITRTSLSNGEMIRIHDFAHEKEMDDLYRLTVRSTDLAGNVSVKNILFSVNRFGSVYTLDEETEKLAGEKGRYYTKQEISMVITEINVDTVVHHEITCNLNGKLKTLIKGLDYRVRESGNENTWKQYEYHIDKENFSEEGHYILTIYSEDRAENVSDNHSKGKTIEFAVDKTAPSILISGVEDQGQYREDSREITVDIQDNIELSEVKIMLNGEELLFEADEIRKNQGRILLHADSKNIWQTVKVSAVDRAENTTYSEEMIFLVTPNIFIQFYRNTPIFYGSISFLVIFGISTGIFLWNKRRKSRNSGISS